MDPLSSLSVFEPVHLVVVPALVFGTIAFFLIPSLLAGSGARVDALVKAICCYVMKCFALLLMGVSALLGVYNMITDTVVTMPVVYSLVLVFAVGLLIFTHFNRVIATIDAASVAVPRAIFHHGCVVLGTILAVLSGLSLMLMGLLSGSVAGLAMPASMLLLSTIFAVSFSLHATPGRGFVSKQVARKR